MRIIESAQNNSETVQEQSKFVQKRSWSCEMDSNTKNTTLSEPRRLALVICVQSPWHRFIRVSDFKNVLMWKLENKHFSVSVTRSESFSWHIFERFEIHYFLISFFVKFKQMLIQGGVKQMFQKLISRTTVVQKLNRAGANTFWRRMVEFHDFAFLTTQIRL